MSKKINPAIAAAAETIAPEVALVATTAIAPFQAISMNLDISLIDPSPLNPRTIFSDEGIQELSDSIQKYGLQSEILVRPKNGRYELIFGERRLRASKKAGLTTIRAKCEDLSDSEAKIRAFIENLQRENLTPIEEGDAFVRLLDEPDMTVKRLCADLGKSEGYVRTRINLMKLIPEVVELLNNKEISELQQGYSADRLQGSFQGKRLFQLARHLSQRILGTVVFKIYDPTRQLQLRQDRMQHLRV